MPELDDLIDKLRKDEKLVKNFIYVNKNTYDRLLENIQEENVDYDSPTIVALNSLQIVIDKDLKDNEYVIE